MEADMPVPPALESARLLLNAPEPSFAQDLFEYGSDPVFAKPLNIAPMLNVTEAGNFLKMLQKDNARGARSYWVAVRKEDQKAVGTLGLIFGTDVLKENECEFGYGFAPSTWGTGLFQEASEAIFTYVFNVLRLDRIKARTRSDNHRAIVSVEKIGFRIVETVKDYYDLPGGRKDCTILALDRPEAE